jgi:hypothetical protein
MLKFSQRTPTGWSPVQTVVSNTRLIVNAADVPSVRSVSENALLAHWTEENGPDPEASTLMISWSKDGGRTWTPPVSPHADKSETQHGFASVFGTAANGFGVLWLDGRTTDTAEMALRSRLYKADGTPGAEMVVDSRVCECCPTATATTADGVVAVFRDRGQDEVRDIYLSRLSGSSWSPPVVVHKDGWKIEACPVNGPSVSAAGNQVAVAWFTVQNTQGHAWAAFSRDGGRTFGAPIRLDDQTSLGRVEISVQPDGSAAASWIEVASNVSQFRVRRIDRSGRPSPAVTIAMGTGTHHPRMALADGEMTLAWTENSRGSTRVHTARAALR